MVKQELDISRDAYRQFTDGQIPCKHIYEDIFFTEEYDPYTEEGYAKLQWANHQVNAANNFLEARTSTKKSLKQLGPMKNASATTDWLSTLSTAVQACEKASNTLRSEKWVSSTQMGYCLQIMSSLIDAKKSFEGRAKALNPEILHVTKFDKSGKVIYALGEHTPQWMQNIAKDALTALCAHILNTHFYIPFWSYSI